MWSPGITIRPSKPSTPPSSIETSISAMRVKTCYVHFTQSGPFHQQEVDFGGNVVRRRGGVKGT